MAATKSPTRDKRDPQALELWRGGASFDLIAKQLGFRDAEAAEAAAVRELGRSPDPDPADLTRLELHRLDVMQMALWPKARRGDTAAIDQVMDIQKQRQRLHALSSISGPELSLLTAIEITVEASEELDPEKDAAVIVAAKKMATQIDAATKTGGDLEMGVKAMYLMPHLANLLGAMLATPAARKAVAAQGKEAMQHGNRLVEYQEKAREKRQAQAG